ncbi:MAG: replicative DNA helicase, partial [Solirubrobacteraceae bacterium]|nr:replicative DNA helicase [Solirubrobacteraceae bacterium]
MDQTYDAPSRPRPQGNGPAPGGPQPHSFDAERAVLGALLLSERAMYTLIIEEGLRPDDFYSQRHRHVFRAMRALYDAGEPFDRLTVKDWLEQHGALEDAGGDATLDELGGPITAAGNVRQYARIVRDHSLMRGLLRATTDIQVAVGERRSTPRE